MPWHANFTEKNHLAKAMLAKPAMMEGALRKMFTSMNYADNPLYSITSNIGATVQMDKDEWTWYLQGAHVRPCVYVGPAAASAQGAYGAIFELYFAENWWVAGDIIHPGNPSKQVRIQTNAIRS